MRVRMLVEYGEMLPSELRDEYQAVPKTREFVFSLSTQNEKLLEQYTRNKVLKEIMNNEEVCKFIKMLDLELC